MPIEAGRVKESLSCFFYSILVSPAVVQVIFYYHEKHKTTRKKKTMGGTECNSVRAQRAGN